MIDLSGKTALITGASSGIGEAIATRFEDAGAKVLSAQRRAAQTGESLSLDLLDPNAADQVAQWAASQTPSLDILVNNAGLMHEHDFGAIPQSDWDAAMQLNVTFPAMLTQAVLPLLTKAPSSVINIGSIEGLGANPRHVAYATSKAAIHGLTKALAVDLGPQSVRVNAVAPGWIDTPLNVEFIESLGNPEQFKKDVKRVHPLRRTGDPSEVANLVAWLGSDDASFMTGQILTIDGGRMAQLSLP